MLDKKILKIVQKMLPPISKTELEALEAGDVGFEGDFFSGKVDWKKLLDMPEPKLTEEEQAFLDGPTQELCDMLNAWEINNSAKDSADGMGDLPDEVWDFMKRNKFLGMVVPKEYDGLGFTALGHSAVVMKIASRSVTAAVTVMVPNSLGPAELIHEYGTQEQKDYYLPRLANGLEIPCFALTGPDNGSDAGAMPDTGVVCKNDKGEIGIKMNWSKRYITLGPVATLIGVAFDMKDPDGLLGDKKEIGITAALIPRETPGVEIGDRHRPMGIPFQNGPNYGHDVFIPLDKIIGGQEMAGQGWKMLMESLSVGRSVSLPSMSVACGKLSTRLTGAYARIRRQFNLPIGKFEGIEEPLARIAGKTYMIDAAMKNTLQMVDQGQKPDIPSAILKYHTTESMRTAVNDAMDIHGGKAIIDGPRNLFQDIYKGIPVGITVEGANIMTRNLIIFGKGIFSSHPNILPIYKAASSGDAKECSKETFKMIANVLLNKGRSFFFGLTNGRGSHVPVDDKDMAKYYRQINRLSASFNFSSAMALAHLGGGLKRKERVSARLGDVLSNLYMASMVLKKFENQGRQKEDLPLAKWAAEQALHDAEVALHDLIDNYPNKFFASVMKIIVFPRSLLPFSARYANKAPSDVLDRQVVQSVMEAGGARDRLTDGIYLTDREGEQIAILEDAFNKVIAAEPLEAKIKSAVKKGELDSSSLADAVKANIITQDEADMIEIANAARDEVVKVDSFPSKNSNYSNGKPKKAKSVKVKAVASK